MARALAQVRLGRISGLAEDVVVNTFNFSVPTGAAGSSAPEIVRRLKAFYLDDPGGTSPVKNILSGGLSGSSGAHEIRVYDMAQPQPRRPVLTERFTLVPPSGAIYPSEVCLCLSLTGSDVSGVPAGRRRGRVYIGPLSQNVTSGSTTGGDARPSAAAQQLLIRAGQRLLAKAAGDVADWVIYSAVDGVSRTIFRLSVDDAFDSQRRRGAKATGRASWTTNDPPG